MVIMVIVVIMVIMVIRDILVIRVIVVIMVIMAIRDILVIRVIVVIMVIMVIIFANASTLVEGCSWVVIQGSRYQQQRHADLKRHYHFEVTSAIIACRVNDLQ
ncbi:hypothetical protein CAPTEDRAFT_192754, partial [Capitella teleta]